MISIKGGTQTWSTAPQKVDYKSDGAQNLSATDRTKALGEDAIGDVLNKVADPNYVDPGKKMRTVGDSSMGKDAFMTLLLAQMKNQDPTNPLKSHEMSAQLAQFTSLEKLNNINDGIEGLRKDQQPSHNFEALSFIGKTISTDNSKVSRMDKDAHHDIRFTLPSDAVKLSMTVKDAEGKPIRTLDFKNLKAGKNELDWNGLTDDGSSAPLGDYAISFEATGSNGRKLAVETKTEGVISGVNFTPHGPQLMVGKQVINMSEVKSISDSSVSESANAQPLAVPAQQKNSIPVPAEVGAAEAAPEAPSEADIQNAIAAMMSKAQGQPASPSRMMPIAAGQKTPAGQGLKKAEVKPENKPNAEKAAKMGKGSNLNDASMAQGLINKLNKDGAKAGMEG